MFRKIALALSAAATVAVPAIADAHGRYHGGRGYSNYGYGYAQSYSYPSYGYSQSYGYPAYGYSQSYGYPSYGYSQGYPAYGYGQSSYGYDGYNGYNGGYNGGDNRYCRNNSGTGVAIGGVTGAVIGSSVAGSNHRYSRNGYGYRGGGGDRVAGALIGGVLGAVVGGAIASGNC